jgi:hypothetical protein
MIVKPSRFSYDAFNYAINCLNLTQRDFYLAVIQDAIQMPPYHCYKIFQGLQPLPSQFVFPAIQKLECPGTAGIIPKGAKNLFKVVCRIQSFIQSECLFEKTLLLGCEIEPPAQKEPPFASYQFPLFTSLTEELSPSYFIDCIVKVTDQVKFVEDDFGVFTESFDTGSKSFPHIHADHLDRTTESRSCSFEKSIKRDGLMAVSNTYDSTSFEVGYDGVRVIHSAETDFVHTSPPDILQRPTIPVVSFKHRVFYTSRLMPGNTMFLCCSGNRLIHSIFKDHSLKTTGKVRPAINEGQTFTTDSAMGTIYPATKKSEKNSPINDRFISIRANGSVLDTGYHLATTITDSCVAIARHYSYKSHLLILEEQRICRINGKTIDSNKGIEYFLSSWHLVFPFPLQVKKEDRSRMSRMPTFLFNAVPYLSQISRNFEKIQYCESAQTLLRV